MNINESLVSKVKKLRALHEDIDDELELSDLDDAELDDYDQFEDQSFGESEVKQGNSFSIDGDFYEWDKPYSDIVKTEDEKNFQVWSAINTDLDEESYFVVDIDDGYLELGPVDSLEEARDYLKDFDEIDEPEIEAPAIKNNKDDFEESAIQSNQTSEEQKIETGNSILDKVVNKPEPTYMNESVKSINTTIKESLNEDLFMMLPPEFEQNQTVEITVPECPCVQCNNMGQAIDAASKVMEAYQNANKWLDIIKESVYTDMSCVFFSSFIHELAHTMPGRFDKFGDILHTMNIKIPYPATQYIPQEPQNINDVFNLVFMILDAIKSALNNFIKCTDENMHGMACAAEVLLNDIEGEYPMWYRLKSEWEQCGEDNIKFDKYVNQYVKNKDDLLESLNEKANRFPTMENRKYKVICANKDEHEVYATSEKDAWDEAEKKYDKVENVYLDESLTEATQAEYYIKRCPYTWIDDDIEQLLYFLNIDPNEYEDIDDDDPNIDPNDYETRIIDEQDLTNAAKYFFKYNKKYIPDIVKAWAKYLKKDGWTVDFDEALTEDSNSERSKVATGVLLYATYEDICKDYPDAIRIFKGLNGRKPTAKEFKIVNDALDSIKTSYNIDRETAEDYFLHAQKIFNESLNEDTVKCGDKWCNKGDEGTHGKFKTKKEADNQRKAMFANGYKG